VPDIHILGRPFIGCYIHDSALVNKMIEGLGKAGLHIAAG